MSVLAESITRLVARLRWSSVWLGRGHELRPLTYALVDVVVLVTGRPALWPRHLIASPERTADGGVELTASEPVADVRRLIGAGHDVLAVKIADKPETSMERRARLRAGEQLDAGEQLADLVAALDLPCATALLAPPVGVGHGLATRPRRATSRRAT